MAPRACATTTQPLTPATGALKIQFTHACPDGSEYVIHSGQKPDAADSETQNAKHRLQVLESDSDCSESEDY
uniref:Uncharacterized protein n=1 Tax=Steinernema glaseri TaxID=37863 RepID=A0A1I7ZV23_9BILA